jgi:hypothetical protein
MLRQPFNLAPTNLEIQRVAEFLPNSLHYLHRSFLETLNAVHESFIGAAYIRIGVIYVTFFATRFTLDHQEEVRNYGCDGELARWDLRIRVRSERTRCARRRR